MTLFFNVINCACVSAYATCCTKYPAWNQNKSHKRRLFLRELAKATVAAELDRRQQNQQAMQSRVKLTFTALGFQAVTTQAVAQPNPGQKRFRPCPRSADRKTKTRGSKCASPC